MLLSSLGTSIANVALPTLAKAFNASFQDVQWIVLAYLLAITTLIVSVGRLGDMIGRRRLLLAGLLLFTPASVLCGAAPALWLLIAARAAQGLGAAIMMALTMAFVGEAIPKERTGSAMGLLGTMSAVGTALGPSLGGILIAALGWRSIFLINLPLGLLTLLLAWRHLPVDRQLSKNGNAAFDTSGHAVARADPCGLCARHDDRARRFRPGQRGAASRGPGRRRPVCTGRDEGRIADDPTGDVPQPCAERKLRDEQPGHDRGDGDAGGRPVLPVRRARARCRPGRTRDVGRPHCRRADGRAGRPHRRPLRRTAHDRHWAGRNGDRRLHSDRAADALRRPGLRHPARQSSPPAMRCSRQPTTPPP